MGGGEHAGKYDGFGNSPIHKGICAISYYSCISFVYYFYYISWFHILHVLIENYGDKMAGLIEKAITIPDERKEVMEMCLASPPTGDFKPISLPGVHSTTDTFNSTSSSMLITNSGAFRNSSEVIRVGQKHMPGRAGGGWEDDIECDQQRIELTKCKPSQLR